MTRFWIGCAVVATATSLLTLQAQEIAPGPVAIQASSSGEERPVRISFHTVYQVEPFALAGTGWKFRSLTIEGQIGGAGTLHVDPNFGRLPEFGDLYVSTTLAVHSMGIALTPNGWGDVSGQDRMLVDIVTTDHALKNRLRLSVPRDQSGSARQIILSRDPKTIERMITLERTPASQ